MLTKTYFLFIIMFLICTVTCYASDNKYVIAVYDFKDLKDDGPNEYHGELWGQSALQNGDNDDRGIMLRVNHNGFFLARYDKPVTIVDTFAISVWIKTNSDAGQYMIGLASFDNDGFMKGYMAIQVLGRIWFSCGIYDKHGNRTFDRQVLEIDNEIHDDEWHHVVFTATKENYRIYIDTKVIKESNNDRITGFSGDRIIIRIGQFATGAIEGNVYYDDVAFLKIGLSEYKVKKIYEDGLDSVLHSLNVSQSESLSTTWGNIKNNKE